MSIDVGVEADWKRTKKRLYRGSFSDVSHSASSPTSTELWSEADEQVAELQL